MKQIIYIGLHSQTLNNSGGIISGSEITTNGIYNAFLKYQDEFQVLRFAPGNYENISASILDLVIIEGWHPSLPEFISVVRKFNAKVKILFWNLSFYGFNGVVKLDVDGFLSNSRKNTHLLNRIKPAKYLMLAADVDTFKLINSPKTVEREVVYLGMYHPSKSEAVEKLILHEASDFNLEIYGHGWETNPILNSYSKGVLPYHKMVSLYNSSKVVLGVTEDRQRKFGMINNRVFEALACGAFFVSEHFIELEQTFGDLIFYSKNIGDTRKSIKIILDNYEQFNSQRFNIISFIRNNHSYEHRTHEFISFYHDLL